MATPQSEREVSDDELAALEDAAQERDASDDELSALEAAAVAPEPVAGAPSPSSARPSPSTSTPASKEEDGVTTFLRAMAGKARAGMAGALNYGTFGLADEFAGMQGAQRDVLRAVTAGGGHPVPNPDDAYMARRNTYRRREESLKDENPGTFHTTGVVSSLLMPSPVPRLGAATNASRLGMAVKGGAISGGLSGFGNSEAELADPEYQETGDAAVDTTLGALTGGAFGAAFQKAGEYIPPLIGKARDALVPWAERRAVKSAMGQNAKAFRSMVDKDTLQDTGRVLLDYDVVKAGRNVEEIRKVVEALQNSTGEDVGRYLGEMDEAMPHGMESVRDRMADAARRNVVAPMERLTSGDAAVARRLQADVDALRNGVGDLPTPPRGETVVDTVVDRPISLTDANTFKSALDKFIRWDSVEPPPMQDGIRQLRGNINGQIESKVDELVGAMPDLGTTADRFREAKRVYGRMADVAVPAINQQARETSNRLASPSDYGSGGVAALLASLASGGDLSTTATVGAGGLLANKFMRERGPQIAADWGNRLSRAGGPLDRLANAAPETVSTVAEALVNPATVAGARGAANAVRPDFSNGPRARSQEPSNQTLMNAVISDSAAFGKYGRRLVNAAQGGAQTFALHDYLLAQSDPEYAEIRKRMLMQANGEQP